MPNIPEASGMSGCFCGSQHDFAQCCKPLLVGKAVAATAEQLMRSRYSAFCTQNSDYLFLTHHHSQRHADDRRLLSETMGENRWLQLKVVESIDGTETDNSGVVEFIAIFERDDRMHEQHERSNFIKENGRWFYVDGAQVELSSAPAKKPARNSPCWCGSGKKYKKCHG